MTQAYLFKGNIPYMVFATSRTDAQTTMQGRGVKFVGKVDPTTVEHYGPCVTTEACSAAIRERNKILFGI